MAFLHRPTVPRDQVQTGLYFQADSLAVQALLCYQAVLETVAWVTAQSLNITYLEQLFFFNFLNFFLSNTAVHPDLLCKNQGHATVLSKAREESELKYRSKSFQNVFLGHKDRKCKPDIIFSIKFLQALKCLE